MSLYFGFNSPEDRAKRRKADLQAIGTTVTDFFWDVAPAHGFEMREGQQDMSCEIVDALIHNQHFAVEAGVGIGKSFGYLVPILLYNKKLKKPVIVATSTIALQEQLWKDIHDVMPLLNTKPEVILAKGQTHYLCHKRANEYLSMEDAIIPKELADGIEQGFQERKQFPSSIPQNIWDKVNIQRFSMRNCGSCEKKCLYYAIRSKLKYIDGIVLCNQDFLTAHLRQLRRGQDGLINREADLIVVDEAHNLEEKVRSATTERVNQGKILGLIKSATNEVRSADRQNVYRETNEAQRAIHAFFDSLKAQMQQQINDAQQDMRYADRFFFDGNTESVNLLKTMCSTIKSAALSIQLYASFDYNSRSTAASDELDELSESLAEMMEDLDKAKNFISKNKKVFLWFGLGLMVVLLLSAGISSCTAMFASTGSAVIATSYLSEDEAMLGAEAQYVGMEAELQDYLDNYESTHSYDEYHFDLDEIEHDPYVLISILSALHEGEFTLSEVQGTLEMLFEKQYILTEEVVVETRYRWETEYDSEGNPYQVRVPYDYYICYVTLENFDLSHVPVYIMSEDQLSMYSAYMSALGNREDLFPGSSYVDKYIENPPADYDVPAEYLDDATFSALLTEAEKYLGYPYVWGGSNPDTSFDCSGFVSYVLTNSGLVNTGRLGAQGLYNICTPISSPQPGDLVFFQGTYDTSGVSHVGIYVGDQVMLHCGDPIQYTSLNSSYWQSHFYAYGRPPY